MCAFKSRPEAEGEKPWTRPSSRMVPSSSHRVVDWMDMGVPEMHKCGLLSITTRWYVGSVDPEKSSKMDHFAAIATDHHYGRIAMLWRSN